MRYTVAILLGLLTIASACSGGNSGTTTSDTTNAVPDSDDIANAGCVASGATRLHAINAYDDNCTVTMAYCAPMPDQWMCASSKRIIRPTADASSTQALQSQLRSLLQAQSGGQGLSAFTLPIETDLNSIPQDPNNPLTAAKVRLGQFIFHDTGFALDGLSSEAKSWSCSTCHNPIAGFKAGIPQGIGEGGVGFGLDGSARQLALGFDPHAVDDADNKPDLQPIAPPATLNIAYQETVLWNGELGNAGLVNSTVEFDQLTTPNTPRIENARGFAGLETQAIAGIGVHRLRMSPQSPFTDNAEYQQLWHAAYPGGSIDTKEDAGKAIAAYVRTIISNRAPFQLWLNGDEQAMNEEELEGALLFFGDAGCSGCHQGPALSTREGAAEHEIFSAVGFADFDTDKETIRGVIPDTARLGRGGFTQKALDNYKFKIPQLYNLADSTVLGHGASFSTIRDVVKYKNAAIPQNSESAQTLDHRFTPLGLSIRDISHLTVFLSTALHDPDLIRYKPSYVPSGECVTVCE